MLRFISLMLVVNLSMPALADMISPMQEACLNKAANDSCLLDNGQAGVCMKSRCSRLDYSSGRPSSVEYDCIICKPKVNKASLPSMDFLSLLPIISLVLGMLMVTRLRRA